MIQVFIHGKNIHCSIVDEGALTSIMSVSCWKAIGSPQLNHSPTTLKSFHRRGFKPCGIMNSLQVELGGKTMSVEVIVINGLLNYNLILGRRWVYAMVVVSTYFR